MQFQIKYGLRANIDKIADVNKIEGCWYICTDTFEVFVCLKNNDGNLVLERIQASSSFDEEIIDLKQRVSALESSTKEIQVNTLFDLPETGQVGIVYIVVKENAAYRWDAEGSNFICIGRDWNEIQCINGGDASSTFSK